MVVLPLLQHIFPAGNIARSFSSKPKVEGGEAVAVLDGQRDGLNEQPKQVVA